MDRIHEKMTIIQDEFIRKWSQNSGFIQKDCEYMLAGLIKTLEDYVKDAPDIPEGKKGITLLKIKNLGVLKMQRIPERKGLRGEIFPETKRITLKLASGIRYAHYKTKPDVDPESDDEEED